LYAIRQQFYFIPTPSTNGRQRVGTRLGRRGAYNIYQVPLPLPRIYSKGCAAAVCEQTMF